MYNALFLGFVGPWQIIVIVLIILLLFGGKKIPELMKGLGEGMNEFKKARENGNTDKKNIDEDAKK